MPSPNPIWATHHLLLTLSQGTPSASLPCHLCQQGCGLAPVTPEPTWQCGFCAAAVHVQCWCNVHGAAAPGVAGALRSWGADAQAGGWSWAVDRLDTYGCKGWKSDVQASRLSLAANRL